MTPQAGQIAHSDNPTKCRKCGTEIEAGKTYRMMFDGEQYLGDQCYGRCTGNAATPAKGLCRYCGIPITYDPQATSQGKSRWSHDEPPVGAHRALPLVIEEDRILQLREELRSMPPGNYTFSEKLLRMVIAKIDKEIGGRPNRLVFLSWVYDRTIRTSKLNGFEKTQVPNFPEYKNQPMLEAISEQFGDDIIVKSARTDGLNPSEGMALLKWAQVAKLNDEPGTPWTFSLKFHADLRMLYIHLGLQMSFLPDEQIVRKNGDE